MKQIDSQNPRFATLKSLALADGSVPCLVGEKHGNRLFVETMAPVAPFSPATVQFEDALFLGEIIAVRQEAGNCTLEIKVEQVLSGLGSLMALRARLLGDAPATVPSHSPLTLAQQAPNLAAAV